MGLTPDPKEAAGGCRLNNLGKNPGKYMNGWSSSFIQVQSISEVIYVQYNIKVVGSKSIT